MTRERFVEVVADVLDHLPALFRERIHNLAVLVEDYPPEQQPRPHAGRPRQILLGIFAGVPRTEKSVFQMPVGPDHIVLYQKNIEAVSRSETELREQIRRTLLHELGHYFGMTEEELRHL
jgi:predicted Zn-dependent protease with MMP-like domain